MLRGAWGAVLLAAPDRILSSIHGLHNDTKSRVITRILGARHLTQAALSERRPGAEVLAMGTWVDTVHALTALALAVSDRDRGRLTDSAVAGLWATAGLPRPHPRSRHTAPRPATTRPAGGARPHACPGRGLPAQPNQQKSPSLSPAEPSLRLVDGACGAAAARGWPSIAVPATSVALRAALVGRDGGAGVFRRQGSSAPVLRVVFRVAQWGVSVFVYRSCGSLRGSPASLV